MRRSTGLVMVFMSACASEADLPSAVEVAQTTPVPGQGLWSFDIPTDISGGHSLAASPDGSFVLAVRTAEGWEYGDPDPDGGGIESDIMVLKAVEGNGGPDIVWVRSYPGNDEEVPAGVAVDENGDILIAGRGMPSFGCADPDGGHDVSFLVKLDGDDGDCLWLRRLPVTESATALAVRGTEIVVAGNERPPLGYPTYVSLSRYGGDGTLRFHTTFGDGELGVSTVGMAGDGRIVVGGGMREPVDFGDGAVGGPQGGAFLVRRDAQGGHEWAVALGDSGSIWSLAVDEAGECAFIGTFSGALHIGGRTYTSGNHGDLIIAKIDTGIGLRWFRRPSGSASILAPRLVMEPSGFVVVSAHFYDGTLKLAPKSYSAGADDNKLFVARLGRNTGNVVWAMTSGPGATWIYPDGLAVSYDRTRVFVAGMYGGLFDLGDDAALYSPDGYHGYLGALQR